MKQQIFAWSGGVISLIAVWLYLTASLSKHSQEVSIAIDFTDSLQMTPSPNKFVNVMRIDKYKWARTKVRITTFSDVEYNESTTISLPAKLALLSNPDTRKSEIDQFRNKFSTALDSVLKTKPVKSHSSLYRPMTQDLNRLAKAKAKRKIAIYQTDCRENSSFFSAYNDSLILALKNNPDSIKTVFEQFEMPGNLTGIEIYLLMKPKNADQNEKQAMMANLFKKIYQDAGASVYIGAGLDPADD